MNEREDGARRTPERDAGEGRGHPAQNSGATAATATTATTTSSLRRLARATMANPRPRRRAMLGCIGVAGALVVLDTTLFGDGLRARPVLFVVYWLVCAWLTLLAVLLAVLDLLVLRAQGRRARRELRERLTREGDEP